MEVQTNLNAIDEQGLSVIDHAYNINRPDIVLALAKKGK